MAKPDTVYSLFGIKSPQQVAREQMEASQALLAVQQDPYARLGTALGIGLGRLTGGRSQEAQQAEQFQNIIGQARQDVTQQRQQRLRAADDETLGLEANLQREMAGERGPLSAPPAPAPEFQLQEKFMQTADLYEAMADRLSNTPGFEAQAEAARNAALAQRMEALKARKQVAEIAEIEATANVAKNVGGIDFSNKDSILDAAGRLAKAGKFAESIRLFDIVTQDPGSAQRDVEYFANEVIRCDINDPNCRSQAVEMAIDYKRTDPTTVPAFKSAQGAIDESYEKARNANQQLTTINESLALLDSGRVNVGSFPKTRQGAEKLYQSVLQSAGFDVGDDDAVARTEQLLANSRQLSAELLGSGIFGAGTGISERDLLEAQQISGAAADLTPEGMKRILELNAKMRRAQIERHNKSLDRFSPKFWESSPFLGKEGYVVTPPDMYESRVQIPSDAPQATDANGTVIYSVNNQWYNADGTPWTGGQ